MPLFTTHLSKIVLAFMLLVISVAVPPQVSARKSYPTVGTDALKSMLDKKDKFVLIDSRTKPEYAEAHIGTAVNIPEKKLMDHLARLPADAGLAVEKSL